MDRVVGARSSSSGIDKHQHRTHPRQQRFILHLTAPLPSSRRQPPRYHSVLRLTAPNRSDRMMGLWSAGEGPISCSTTCRRTETGPAPSFIPPFKLQCTVEHHSTKQWIRPHRSRGIQQTPRANRPSRRCLARNPDAILIPCQCQCRSPSQRLRCPQREKRTGRRVVKS